MKIIAKVTPTQIDTITCDVTTSEVHQGEVEVTDHPVEEGANVTDHARTKPAMFTVEGIVTNTPLNSTQSRRIVEAFGQQLETTSPEDALRDSPGYAEEAYAKLEALRRTPKLITVITQLRTYTNMLMTSLSVPRDPRTGDALRFSATFRELVIVKNKTTTLRQKKTKKANGRRKVRLGKKSGKRITDAKVKAVNKQFNNVFEDVSTSRKASTLEQYGGPAFKNWGLL